MKKYHIIIESYFKKYFNILKNISITFSRKLYHFLKMFWRILKIQYRWIIILITILILLGFFILSKFPQMSKGGKAELYLLSAISQSLAAIFALVFTITLVILRISYQFRGLLGEFFKDPFNVFYFILSAIAIILPFWILRIEVTVLGLNICLVLASTCVLFTLPFFLRMKNFLEIQVGIRQLLQTAKEDIQREDIYEYRHKLRAVFGLAIQGMEERQYNIIPVIYQGYIILCQKCYLHFGTTENAVSRAIKYIFHTAMLISCYKNALNKMEDVLYDIAKLVSSNPTLTQLDFSSLFDTLTTAMHEEVKQRIRSMACSCAWILSINWLKMNSKKENYVKKKFVSLMTMTNQQFVIDCCNKMYTIMQRSEGSRFFLSDEEKVILKKLKRWATKVDIKKFNRTIAVDDPALAIINRKMT